MIILSLLECLYDDFIFFFKQKTAYEMRISDWSSDVCSSDLAEALKTLGDARFGFLQAEEEAAVTRSRRFYGQFEAKQGFAVTGARTEQHEIASYKVSQ